MHSSARVTTQLLLFVVLVALIKAIQLVAMMMPVTLRPTMPG